MLLLKNLNLASAAGAKTWLEIVNVVEFQDQLEGLEPCEFTLQGEGYDFLRRRRSMNRAATTKEPSSNGMFKFLPLFVVFEIHLIIMSSAFVLGGLVGLKIYL